MPLPASSGNVSPATHYRTKNYVCTLLAQTLPGNALPARQSQLPPPPSRLAPACEHVRDRATEPPSLSLSHPRPLPYLLSPTNIPHSGAVGVNNSYPSPLNPADLPVRDHWHLNRRLGLPRRRRRPVDRLYHRRLQVRFPANSVQAARSRHPYLHFSRCHRERHPLLRPYLQTLLDRALDICYRLLLGLPLAHTPGDSRALCDQHPILISLYRHHQFHRLFIPPHPTLLRRRLPLPRLAVLYRGS